MRITVLYGGPGSEREVSLVSGKAVIEGLRGMGHEVFPGDVAPGELAALERVVDVVFPVLHGEFGESGELQEILEKRGLPFVGSGSKASRLGINKVQTKKAWQAAGLPTPAWQIISRDDLSPQALAWAPAPGGSGGPSVNAMVHAETAMASVPIPCVAKAVSSGSSIDVFLCRTREEAITHITDLAQRLGQVLVEQLIEGPELTVGLLDERPLAPIRIVPKRAFFDYQDKYGADGAEHRFDTGLPADVISHCQALAQKANAVVGACDLSRIDIMLDKEHKPYLLEINTLPGFTPKSLLPEAARHAGMEFGPLVDHLARRAQARGPRNG